VKKKLALITASVALAASGNLHAANQWGLTPYVGADVQSRHMNWDTGSGGNLFTHDAVQGNVYFGVKFSENFGIEGGYESTAKKVRSVFANPGELVTGTALGSANPIQFTTTTRLRGHHINLVSSASLSETHRLKLLGLIGIVSLKASLTRQPTASITGGVFTSRNGPTTPLIQRKNLLRLGTTLEHLLTDAWGIRGSITWENTKRLKIFASNGANGIAQPKNSLVYGLGAFITF
jgi:opacity protein-like surface antigen